MGEKEQLYWVEKLQHMDYKTPFMVTDLSEVQKNVQTLKKLLPRVDIFYAVKSNNDPQLIKAIDSLVFGYEIASIGEYDHLKSLGITSDRILYSNPVKVPYHIKRAHQEKIQYFAYDSLTEIAKLAELAPGSNVYTRLKVSDQGSQFPLSRKFGITPEKAVEYACLAKKAGLNPSGIAFHVGSQSENPDSWEAAIASCGQIIGMLEKKGIATSFINLGGGIPAPYIKSEVPLQQIATTINKALQKHIPDTVRVMAEPGRSVSASSSVIVTSVIGRETREGKEEWLFLDMGVFQGLIEPLEMPSWRYPIFSRSKPSGSRSIPFVLTGPTCDAYDTIGSNYSLPDTLTVNDQLCIGSAGAYTTVYKSNFNGFSPPKTYYLTA